MIDVPDAPWIREAEIFGMPEGENVYCPACNEENPEWYVVDDYGSVIGCSDCLGRIDPREFYGLGPTEATVVCPLCGAEDPEWFEVGHGQIFGCSCCTGHTDPFDNNYR